MPVREVERVAVTEGVSFRCRVRHVSGSPAEPSRPSGAIALDDARRASRVEARWDRVDARQIPRSPASRARSRRAARPSSNGVLTAHRRPRASTSPRRPASSRRDGRLRSWCSGSGRGRPLAGGDVRLATPSGVSVTATADIGVDSRALAGVDNHGRVVLRTTDLAGLIRQAREFGVPADRRSRRRRSVRSMSRPRSMARWPLMRSTGRIIGHAVTLAGRRGWISTRRSQSTSPERRRLDAFRVLAPALESATFVTDQA